MAGVLEAQKICSIRAIRVGENTFMHCAKHTNLHIMHIQLLRYHHSPQGIRSQLMLDGAPFCHAHEPHSIMRSHDALPQGTYRCKCFASLLSPMTLKVIRQKGKAIMMFGWDALKQWQSNVILIGQTDSTLPPERQELDRQQDTFDAFTQHVYEAYAKGEPITLEVSLT